MTWTGTPAYPAAVDTATADALSRHLAFSAQQRWHTIARRLAEANAQQIDFRAYLDAAAALTCEYGLAMLLTELKHLNPDVADDAARRLWTAWEQTERIGRDLWDLLSGHGIDPEEVNRVADRAYTTHPARPGHIRDGQIQRAT